MQKVITHDGSFHTDDVFAVAALQLYLGIDEVEVIRTRDAKIMESADWLVDVGGVYDPATKRFDHHQDGAPVRESGLPYAAFGLVWREIGEVLVGSAEGATTIDERLVQPVDAGDNGVSLYKLSGEIAPFELYNVIGLHAPVWGSTEDKNIAFLEAVETARMILEKMITHVQAGEAAKAYAAACYEAAEDKRVVVCDQSVGKGYFVDYEDVLFVITPSEGVVEQTWRATALPKNHHTFETRVPFPEAWCGLRDAELQKVSDVGDARFVHKAGFLFVAESKDSAIEAVQRVLNQ